MSKCPECKKQIDKLVEVSCEYVATSMQLDKDGNIVYPDKPETRDSELIHFECAKCNEMLFSKYGDAVSFLRGGEKS